MADHSHPSNFLTRPRVSRPRKNYPSERLVDTRSHDISDRNPFWNSVFISVHKSGLTYSENLRGFPQALSIHFAGILLDVILLRTYTFRVAVADFWCDSFSFDILFMILIMQVRSSSNLLERDNR